MPRQKSSKDSSRTAQIQKPPTREAPPTLTRRPVGLPCPRQVRPNLPEAGNLPEAREAKRQLVMKYLGVNHLLGYMDYADGSAAAIAPDGKKYRFTARQLAEMQ